MNEEKLRDNQEYLSRMRGYKTPEPFYECSCLDCETTYPSETLFYLTEKEGFMWAGWYCKYCAEDQGYKGSELISLKERLEEVSE